MNELWLTDIIKAVRQAGNQIMEIYHSDYSIRTKDDNSPVTDADFASNSILTKSLAKTHIPVISEEENTVPYSIRKNYKKVWLLDPLDGTKEFIGKHDDFAINIALIKDHQSVFGLIYLPVNKEIYYATKGQGAYLITREGEKKKLPFAERKSKEYIFLKSRSHPDKQLEKYINNLARKKDKINVKIVGSSIKFCEIAKGTADEYTRFNATMEWDTAAGQIIIEEAGKTFIDHQTNAPMRYNRENLKNGGFTIR